MSNQIYEYISVFVMSWLFVYGLTPFVIRFARWVNFVDRPEARKIHATAIPLMGGLSVFIGFFLLCLYDVVITATRTFDLRITGYLTGSVLIVLIGLYDDRYGMKPLLKLVGQILVSLIFILTNFEAPELYTLFGAANLNLPSLGQVQVYLALPLLVLWMVGLMNAFNFLDNMDGIITGMAAILGLGFFAFSLMNTAANAGAMALIALISLSFSGAALGFLPYNFNPARIFLGDAGSMFIGYFLSSMGILMAQFAKIRHNDKWFYLLPVLILSYAIFDIALVSVTRKRDGRHVMQGGKDHSTHRIHTVLGSAKITAVMIYLINLIIVLTTIVIYMIGSRQLLLITTGLFAVIFIVFGIKLDKVPIVVPQNQLKSRGGK